MKFLLTNDDGIDAPGIKALWDAAGKIGEPTLVAPVHALSGCSHRVTTDQPLRLLDRGAGHFALDGTPADCTRIGLLRVVPDAKWVLSGINAGGNLGADVHLSGTVAAVREAVIHGWPGIAVSQYRKKGIPFDWSQSARWVAPLLRLLIEQPWKRGTFWNINLPHLDPDADDPEVVFCRVDPCPLPLSYREEDDLLYYDGNYHLRDREPGTDVDVCFSGKVAVSLVSLF